MPCILAILCVTLGFGLLTAWGVAAADRPAQSDRVSIAERLAQIRSQSDDYARGRLVFELVDDVKAVGSSAIDEATIDDIAGLLEDSYDDVRSWAAMAIAAPALARALEVAKDYRSNVGRPSLTVNGLNILVQATSVHEICYAIQEIGADAPGCVDGHYEDP